MRAFLLSIAAAMTALAGAAEARTIRASDFGGAGGVIDLGGARIVRVEPAPQEQLSRSDLRDRALLRCAGPRGVVCVADAARRRSATDTMLQIFLDEGVSLSNLSFDDNFTGEAPDAARAVVVNGVAYRLSDLSKLTLTGETVVINLDAAAAQQLSLRSFDLSSLDAPLPAAGFLMIGGLGGIALATTRQKRRRKTI